MGGIVFNFFRKLRDSGETPPLVQAPSEPIHQPIENSKSHNWIGPLFDGIYNLISQIGTESDRSTHTRYKESCPILKEDIAAALRRSGVLNTFLKQPAKDAFSGWVKFTGLDSEESKALNEHFKKIGLKKAFKKAYIAMRRTGFAAVWIDTGAASVDKPLNPAEIKRFRRFVVFDGDTMEADRQGYTKHTEPIWWKPIGDMQSPHRIHSSRLLIFPGEEISDEERWENCGKGNPAISQVWDSWLDRLLAHRVIPNIAQTYEENVIKMEGLNQKITTPQGRKLIHAKAADQSLTASFLKARFIDSQEEVQRLGAPISGLEKMLERADRNFLSDSGLPHSILFGLLPGGGLGGTGETEGEMERYHKFIASEQDEYLTEPLEQAISLFQPILQDTYRMKFEDLSFEWNPLKQHSEKEWAEIENKQADTDTKYKNAGVVDAEELRGELARRGTYAIDPKRKPLKDAKSKTY